jgi:membrane protein implicated in regulation of membrane protease activity
LISVWLLQFEIWIIIGIIFILLELTDGSAIFFLPLGIGSLILSFYIYLCNIQIIHESLIIDTWYIALVSWAILSLITSLLISLLRKKYSKENPDINDY